MKHQSNRRKILGLLTICIITQYAKPELHTLHASQVAQARGSTWKPVTYHQGFWRRFITSFLRLFER